MMGFFVEQELLGWELINERSETYSWPSFPWEAVAVFIKLYGGFMLCFAVIDFVPIFIITVGEVGFANLSFAMVVEMVGWSLLFAGLMISFVVVITIIGGVFEFCRERWRQGTRWSVKDRVSIGPESIMAYQDGVQRMLKYADYDFYSFGSFYGAKGNELNRYLILVNEKTRVDTAVEIGLTISEQEIDLVMLEFLPRDYAYQVDFKAPKVAY